MSEMMNATVILCKCGKKKGLYGIRLEEKRPRQWEMNWAFAISENRARKEKYGESKIQGSFDFSPEYPGCPYCGTGGIFTCHRCQEISCWDGSDRVTCAHCGTTANIGGSISELKTGGDI
jgi:hypothetical protein